MCTVNISDIIAEACFDIYSEHTIQEKKFKINSL